MSRVWQQLLSRIDQDRHADALRRARQFLRSNGLKTVRSKPAVRRASEILSIWKVREKNSNLTGVSIPGVETLVRNLEALAADSEVEQFGFTGDEFAGSLFFDRKTRHFLGDTIVERQEKSKRTLDLEAELLEPTRKSA
jgi:hypothetical protein